MLITFKSSSYANITMFGDVGLKMLEMMGFGKTVPGAIGAADVPRALQNLQQGLKQLPQPEQPPDAEAEGEAPISLQTRALPLLELLRATAASEKAVRWECSRPAGSAGCALSFDHRVDDRGPALGDVAVIVTPATHGEHAALAVVIGDLTQ